MSWRKQLFENLPEGWEEMFNDLKEDLEEIEEVIEYDQPLVPDTEFIFHPYYLLKPAEVKMVWVFKEPLEGYSIASSTEVSNRSVGLGCSVRYDDIIPRASLNIYDELSHSANFHPPNHGDLTEWARKGLFFMTLSMTTFSDPQKRGNHAKIWAIVLRKTCELIAQSNKNVIFILFGRDTLGVKHYVSSSITMLEAPAPGGQDFKGCGIFKKLIPLLQTKQSLEFDWNCL